MYFVLAANHVSSTDLGGAEGEPRAPGRAHELDEDDGAGRPIRGPCVQRR